MSARTTCSRFAEIGRSAAPETVPELRQHLDQCLYCQSQWAAMKRLIEVSLQIPTKAPEAGRRMQTRNALVLAAAESGRRRGSSWWVRAMVYASVALGAAGVFAAVGEVAIPWFHRQRAGVPASDRGHGKPQVSSQPTARTEPVLAPETGVPVEPQLRIPVGGKSPGRQAASARPRGALASVSLPASAPRSAQEPSPAELAFSEGWQALRAVEYARAAAAMRRAWEAAPTSALATDARYWEAVALARQGSVAQARAAMEEFLRRFPGSPRTGEVSAMLGWSYLESHEWAKAERLFRAAESDRTPAVRDSAEKGLEITARQARSKTVP